MVALSSFALVAALSAAASIGVPPPVNMCRPGEQVLFNCLNRRQAFFLCGSKDLSQTRGSLQYRAFKDGALQMSYPAQHAPPSGRFFKSTEMYSGGLDTHVRFDNGGYTYVLFSSFVSWPVDMKNHRRSTYDTGIVVWRGGKLVSRLACRNPDAVVAEPVYRLIPEEPFQPDLVPDPDR